MHHNIVQRIQIHRSNIHAREAAWSRILLIRSFLDGQYPIPTWSFFVLTVFCTGKQPTTNKLKSMA